MGTGRLSAMRRDGIGAATMRARRFAHVLGVSRECERVGVNVDEEIRRAIHRVLTESPLRGPRGGHYVPVLSLGWATTRVDDPLDPAIVYRTVYTGKYVRPEGSGLRR